MGKKEEWISKNNFYSEYNFSRKYVLDIWNKNYIW